MSERTDRPVNLALVNLDIKARVVTIGTFDGVHLGHQALIEAARKRALELGIDSMAVTFEPPPVLVLRPDVFKGRVASSEDKIEFLKDLGLDEVVTISFNRDLAQLTPEAFMEMLAEGTGLRELWVGEAFALGKNRAGNVDRLKEIGTELGFNVVALSRVTDSGQVISSSSVRHAVESGDVAQARRFLGRPFRISGEVVHGAHLGRTIGYPTANVVPPEHLVPLADGIYVSLARIGEDINSRPAMTYVGTRPTVNSGDRLIETHLLDFNGDLYGQIIHVDFLERLRGDAVFAGVDALVAQLREDELATRTYLEAFIEMDVD